MRERDIVSLENALEESSQQQILLTHSLQDRSAELDIERVRNKTLQDELSSEKSASVRLCSRAEKAEGAALNVKQQVENFVQAISAQEASQRAALSRLVTLGQRVSFATKRVDTIQGMVAQKFALMRLSQEEKPCNPETNVFRPSYEDLETEVTLLHEERDRLSAELKRSALMVEAKVTETRDRLETELAECQNSTSLLRQALHETQEQERALREQLEETEKRLQEAEESVSQLREQLQKQQGDYEKVLQSRVNEVEAQKVEQLAQMEKHLHEARREHTKAVVALRQAERQSQRDKDRSQETLHTVEEAARIREEQLSKQLREAERDKNLMTATLRQEGLLATYQKNRSAVKREVDQGHNLIGAQASGPIPTHAVKESISSMLDNLQSLGTNLLKDDDEEELPHGL
ncbi:coiled-coil alpha-helical rod protein 1 [Discoglossus pictus]